MSTQPQHPTTEPNEEEIAAIAEEGYLFGYPLVPVATMLDWVADWVGRGMPSYDKPTKYEVRDGDF